MKLWEPHVEYLPTVVWDFMVLPDEPKVIAFNEAQHQQYWSRENNKKQKVRLRRYIHSHGILKKLDLMIERELITREQVA